MTYTTYKVTRDGEEIVFEKTTLPANAVKQDHEGFSIAGEGIGGFYSEEGFNLVMGINYLVGDQVYLSYPDNMLKPIAADFLPEVVEGDMSVDWIRREIVYR